MAVLARPSERLDRSRTAEYGAVAEAMTLGAYPWPRHFQHIFIGAAVRVVTAQAILPHRCMLEQERSALFGVALVAVVVDRVFPQHCFGGGAVRIVTVRAGDLSFPDRHVRRAENLSAPILVALEAGFQLGLGLEVELERNLTHHRVAFAASDPSRFVGACVPVSTVATLMAGETDRVVVLDPAGWIVLAERNDAPHAASIGRYRRSDASGLAHGRQVSRAGG